MIRIIGSRGSVLARTQTHLVEQLINQAHSGESFQIKWIKSEGDISTAPLSQIGGRGVFTADLSKALLAGSIDMAVHSLKDLPTAPCEGLTLGAILEREDPRDVLVSKVNLGDLPQGAVIGTGSLRRRSQLMQLRPDLKFEEIRGNVHTRIQKVLDGQYDATLLAQAGLNRLENSSDQPPSLTLGDQLNIYPFATAMMTPAVAQAAIAIECRSNDECSLEMLKALDHAPTRQAVEIERNMLRRLGGGCQVPFAAHVDAHEMLHLVITDEKGYCQRLSGPMSDSEALMDDLLKDGQKIVDFYLNK